MIHHYLGPGSSITEGPICGETDLDAIIMDRPTYTTCRACLLRLPDESQRATWATTDRYFVLGIAAVRPAIS